VKRAKRYAHHWPLSTAEVKNVCLRVVVRHCHIYCLQDTDGCFGAVQRECLLPGGLEQWSPKWGAHDIPWGCEEENKPRRPSADIMYIYCVPIYVYIHIYTYILYKFINKCIAIYLGCLIIIFTDTGVRDHKSLETSGLEDCYLWEVWRGARHYYTGWKHQAVKTERRGSNLGLEAGCSDRC
jgi:hypothetical protein